MATKTKTSKRVRKSTTAKKAKPSPTSVKPILDAARVQRQAIDKAVAKAIAKMQAMLAKPEKSRTASEVLSAWEQRFAQQVSERGEASAKQAPIMARINRKLAAAGLPTFDYEAPTSEKEARKPARKALGRGMAELSRPEQVTSILKRRRTGADLATICGALGVEGEDQKYYASTVLRMTESGRLKRREVDGRFVYSLAG